METIHRAETLLLQARSLGNEQSDKKPRHWQRVHNNCAMEAIEKTEKKKHAQGILSSEVASLFQEYSREK